MSRRSLGSLLVSHQNTRAAFCVGIGNFSGILSGTPAKRAERFEVVQRSTRA
jgi:hypothetical protein